jgi:hypothetical protein
MAKRGFARAHLGHASKRRRTATAGGRNGAAVIVIDGDNDLGRAFTARRFSAAPQNRECKLQPRRD